MAEPTTLIVVPHTHWDREWYQTFQQFRRRLVHAVDGVLDVLEHDPAFHHFMLDGQTIPLDDYLEVRPENADRLRTLARAGRLLVGPWFLQPDEFLVGGESLIRNLQIGLRAASDYGGAMPIGYVPDLFGHIGQLPQILRGMGLGNAVLWRGVGEEVDHSEFRWAAPDGTNVLAVWLCDEWGYSNARTLPLEPEVLQTRLRALEEPLRQRATTGTLLLMNGSDHLEPQAGLPQAIAAVNARLQGSGTTVVIGTLPDYIAAIERADPPLATHTGELRSSRYAHLLPGVLSTRMWIKQRNAACEAALVRWAEPAAALAWSQGATYPGGLLRVAWRHLLTNHPHDSICGCSIDQVHEEMRPRFDQSEQIADMVASEALAHLAERVDTRALGGDGVPIVVFNPSAHARTDLTICELEVPSGPIEVVDEAGEAVPCHVAETWTRELLAQELHKDVVTSMIDLARPGRLEGYSITGVAFHHEAGTSVEDVLVTVSDQAEPDLPAVTEGIEHILASARRDDVTSFRVVVHEVQRARVELLAADVPPLGARTYSLRARRTMPDAASRSQAGGIRTEASAIENELFRVEADGASGTFTLLDKKTGVRFPGLNQFVDGGDVGDLYNFCPPVEDTLVSRPHQPAHVEVVADGAMRATLRLTMRYALPRRCVRSRHARHSETVECAITTEVSLAPGVRRVSVRTTVHNAARDHRLRVLFPVPFQAEWSHAEGAFTVVQRPARQREPAAGEAPWSEWAEAPVDTHPQKRFVDVSDGTTGLAVLNRGLPEYEVVPGSDRGGGMVALTLLRAVEWLSRGDLATRRGHAGPALLTPGGQCLGDHAFEYALVPHAGRWDDAGMAVTHLAEDFEAGLRAVATGTHEGVLPAVWAGVSLEPAELALSALKRAEREDALVLRAYNPTARPINASVRLQRPIRAVRLVNLNEDDVPAVEAAAHQLTREGDETVRLSVRGGEIVTLLFDV
jgi:mannosylglycerate hydrolase